MALIDSLDSLTEPQQGIKVESLEVGGARITEIKDKKGHIWAIPADDENVNLREYRNILDIPNPESGFYYQYVDGSRLNEFLTQQFVLVDRDEIGIPTKLDVEGNPLLNPTSTHHQVGNLHLVKIPKALEQRMRRVQQMRADEAVASIKVPRHLGKPQIGENGVQIRDRKTEVVSGPPVVMTAKDFQEFREE